MGDRVKGVTARIWHMANLPAGTNVQRLRVQVGQLDREVRRLSLQLAAQNQAPAEGVSDRGAEPGERACRVRREIERNTLRRATGSAWRQA